MVILNSKKVIYIHIHKTGGETVEYLLGKVRAWNDIILGQDHPGMTQEFEQYFNLNKHSRALHVANVLGLDQWNSYFSWSIVRNPYGRIASLYSYLAAISEPHLSLIGFPLNASREVQRDWMESADYPRRDQWAFAGVRAYLETRASQFPFSEFLRHRLLNDEPAYRSQFQRLCNAAGDALLVNRVVKLEVLPSLWPQLCSEMRIPPIGLQVKNATPNAWKRSVRDLFTESADVEFINTVHADDFRWFNYEIVGRNPVPRAITGSGPRAAVDLNR